MGGALGEHYGTIVSTQVWDVMASPSGGGSLITRMAQHASRVIHILCPQVLHVGPGLRARPVVPWSCWRVVRSALA